MLIQNVQYVIGLSFVVFGLSSIACVRAQGEKQAPNPIVFDIFYESRCPDSKKLLNNQIGPLVAELKKEPNGSEAIKFRYWPYGKASETYNNETSKYDFKCHHGPPECFGNLYHICALYGNLQQAGDALAFITCTFRKINIYTAVEDCSKDANFNYTELSICANSVEANHQMHQIGEKTNSQTPPVTYVPWVLINNVYTVESRMKAEADLKGLVCKLTENYYTFCK